MLYNVQPSLPPETLFLLDIQAAAAATPSCFLPTHLAFIFCSLPGLSFPCSLHASSPRVPCPPYDSFLSKCIQTFCSTFYVSIDECQLPILTMHYNYIKCQQWGKLSEVLFLQLPMSLPLLNKKGGNFNDNSFKIYIALNFKKLLPFRS